MLWLSSIVFARYFAVRFNISQIHDSMRKTHAKNIAETCFDTVKPFSFDVS